MSPDTWGDSTSSGPGLRLAPPAPPCSSGAWACRLQDVQKGGWPLSKTREFEYKGKQVKVSATKTIRGTYVGVPIIEGSVPKNAGMGEGKRTVNEALGEGERKAKDFID